MCLLICHLGADGSLLAGANRDERYDRPAVGPFLWQTSPRVFAGRDELGGGTWLAVSERGLASAVTNRPTAGGEDASRPSRGLLPLLACRCGSSAEARETLRGHLAARRYNGFSLFVADAAGAFVVQCPGGQPDFRDVEAGLHVVANGAWDDRAEARVGRAFALLADRLEAAPAPAGGESAMAALMEVCRDHGELPDGSTLCFHGRGAGTVSSTVLAVGADGRVVRYLHADGPPCRSAYREMAVPFGARR